MRSADVGDDPTGVQIRSADYTNSATFGQGTGRYVYGLERQPFITEVVAKVDDLDEPPDGNPDTGTSMYGVELYNPYGDRIYLSSFRLRTDKGFFDLDGSIPPYGFAGFYGYNSPGGGTGNDVWFKKEGLVELTRNVDGTDVVVDEVNLEGTGVGTMDGLERSVQRYVVSKGLRWYASVPFYPPQPNHSFGGPTSSIPISAYKPPPVEMEIADSGSLRSAFPTTGSLLLLMRYANSDTKPFTRSLSDELYAVDNGRMPIFDATGDLNHHLDPKEASTTTELSKDHGGDFAHLPWGQLVFDYFTVLPLENRGRYVFEPDDDEKEWPRVDLDGLRVHGRINLNSAPWKVLQGIPFIPIKRFPLAFQETFREVVRDTTPWDYVEDQGMPIGEELAKAIVAYREMRQITWKNGDTGDYGATENAAGKWIPSTSRHWKTDVPDFRRGMGFLTVGELANVRHPDATGGYVRFDDGVVGAANPTYLDAVAKLVCLSDWVTVRSQVFTIYGTLRGEIDDTIIDKNAGEQQLMRLRDVDSRAIRFQETVDRLPTFLGEDAPTRIGNRVLANYSDTRSD